MGAGNDIIQAIIHGFILAQGLILPLGAQNVFIFNQGAAQSRFVRTMPVIIIAGISDTTLILLAVLGVSVIVFSLAWVESLLFILGTLFLLYMGWITWRSKPEQSDHGETNTWTLRRQIIFTLSVSLLNPHAILDTVGVIGTSSLSYSGDARVAFTITCIIVSWLWFLTLAVAGRIVGTTDRTGKIRKYLNQVSALIMWVSAVYLASQLL